jgi:tetratricopeptide (TPR) repeat protein
LSRGLVYLKQGKLRESLDDCERAIRLDPESSKARMVRHQAGHAATDLARAMFVVEQALRDDTIDPIGPTSGPAQVGAEPAAAGVDEHDTAALEGRAPARPVPRTAAEFFASGQRWFDDQEYDKAISDYNEALKLDARFAQAYVSRARAWVQKHYRERELADIDAAISIEPRNATYRVARAESWSARGLNGPAMADYAEAIRLDPENPAIWVSRGNEWRKDHKINQAIADYTQAIKLDPKYVPAYIARANTWKQIRRFDYTIQELANLIRMTPQDPLPHQTLARVLSTSHEDQFRDGKRALDEAIAACELTHWMDPDAIDTLAAASAENGDFVSAVRWQCLAIKLVRQRFPSALQKKAVSMGGGRGAGMGFEDRLAFYKSRKPIRE